MSPSADTLTMAVQGAVLPSALRRTSCPAACAGRTFQHESVCGYPDNEQARTWWISTDDAATIVQLCARDLRSSGMLCSLLCAGQRARFCCKLCQAVISLGAEFAILTLPWGPVGVRLCSIAGATAYTHDRWRRSQSVSGPR